jgi:hypothetical protein
MEKLKKWGLVLVIILFSAYGINGYAKPIASSITNKPLSALKTDSIAQEMGSNKVVPEKYKSVIFHALSYFPELKNTHIQFKFADISTTLNARPTLWSLIFCKKESRRYVVRINNNLQDSIINFSGVPYDAQLGVLAHEFCHFADYAQKNIWGVMGRLLDYTNHKRKKAFENEIDQKTIKRGLGWQLYSWSYYVLYESNAKQEYKEFKKEVYLTPRQIEKLLFAYRKEYILTL